MVDIGRVATLHHLHGAFGQRGFHVHYGCGFCGCLFRGIAQQLEHIGNVLDVRFLQFYRFFISLQVIVAFRQGESSLIHLCDHFLRVLKIRSGAKIKECANANPMQVRHFVHQARLALHGVDAVKFRLQYGYAFFIDGLFIHAGSVIVTDFLLVGGAAGRRLGCLFKNLMQHSAVVLCQLIEASPTGLVRGNRIVLQPAAAGILVKVLAGIRGLVQACKIKAGDLFGRF